MLPTADRKIAADDMEVTGGGVTANNLVQAARLGLSVAWAGALGEDQWGEYLRRQLAEEHVEVIAEIPKGSISQQAWIAADTSGATTITLVLGASRKLTPAIVREKFADAIRATKHLHLEVSVTPLATALEAARIAHDAGVRVIVDVDSDPWYLIDEEKVGTAEEFREILALAYAAKFSHGAARGYLRTASVDLASVPTLLGSGAQMVAITLGADGCIIGNKETTYHVPGFDIASVDTVGAGDAFMGGLSYGILQGWDLEHTGRFANACGACKCLHPGARGSAPLGEVENLLKR
jgi:ribokinase